MALSEEKKFTAPTPLMGEIWGSKTSPPLAPSKSLSKNFPRFDRALGLDVP